MKRLVIFLSVVVSLVFISLSMSCKEPDPKGGIQFFEGTWEAALAKAKSEQKPILLDIYATWCGPCNMLKKKTFTDRAAGDYFNANYINVSMDGENGEGIALAEKYRITGYPTLIILNKNGDLLAMQAGYISPEGLVEYGKEHQGK